LLLAACGLAACRILPEPATAPRLHDLGPNRPANENPRAHLPPGLVLDSVDGPASVRSTAVHYRFLFEEPTRLRSYASVQWAAPPPALLEERLGQMLPPSRAGSGGAPTRRLKVRLEAFEQQFSSPVNAEAYVELRATLEGSTFATTVIIQRRPTTPDVQGAVAGLAVVADQSMVKLLAWLASLDSARSSRPVIY
jgi:cholesterol transport system auxiliary component